MLASGDETSNRPVVGEVVDAVDEAARGEQRDDLRRRLLGGLSVAGDDDLGRLRRLVTLSDTGEIFDLSGHGFFVKTFGIAPDAFRKGRIDENLDKFILADEVADHGPLGPERRNKRAKNHETSLRHELGDLANAADVFDPIKLRKSQILIEPVPNIIAVEQDGVDAMRVKPGFNEIGDRRFARAGKARKPYHGGFMMLDAGTVLLTDVKTLEMNVGRPAKTKGDHSRRRRGVGYAVN